MHELAEGKSNVNVFDSHVFGLKYHQLQALLQHEVRMAAGHFSHTIHRVNLSAFYYLSFNTKRELTVVLLKDEQHDDEMERNRDEDTLSSSRFSRFYNADLPE